VQRAITRQSSCLPEENIDDPLRHEVQATLQEQWKAWYGWHLPPSWRGPDSLLGRFHREFLKRNHVLYQIKKIRSLEMATSLGPSQRRHAIGNVLDICIQTGDAAAEVSISSVFTYLMGLRIVLYTMALAGSFKLGESTFFPLGGKR
jgi:hypothetical protein